MIITNKEKSRTVITTYQQLRFRCINLIGSDEIVNFKYECLEGLLYRLTEEQMESIFDIEMSDINKKRFGRYISYNENLTEEFILKYEQYLFIPVIFKRIDLSEEGIKLLFDKHGYVQVLEQKNLTIEFIEQVKHKLLLRMLSYNTKVDESILERYFDELDKFYLSFRKYSREFLIKHVNELNIGALLINNDLTGLVPENILNEYRNRMEKCSSLSIYENELFIERDLSILKDNDYKKIDLISSRQYLTEYIIDKYKDILNMDLVKKYQLEYKE